LVVFVADAILPRGATAAIGYCAVPAVAAGTRRIGFVLSMMAVCTVLTWTAFFIETQDYPAWKSAFDRAVVTAVLWLVLVIVLRRLAAFREVLRQRQALRDAALELERSNRELSNFASVVAHDLRGPLNTIGLFAELLSRSAPVAADPAGGEAVGAIRSELERANQFIKSLLAYGRVGAGAVKPKDCDCASILDEVRRHLRADLERAGAEIVNDPLPVVRADPVLIAELFQNLIENAIKYRREQTPLRVHVSASRRADGWLFAVRDNGIGVRPEDAARIFEPFYQTHAGATAGKGAGNGVGLGLATCTQIVERHGGRIHAEPAPGEGTTFLFTIVPAPDAPAAVAPARDPDPFTGTDEVAPAGA
jgi:signal transduction histidine kinase